MRLSTHLKRSPVCDIFTMALDDRQAMVKAILVKVCKRCLLVKMSRNYGVAIVLSIYVLVFILTLKFWGQSYILEIRGKFL